MSQKTDQRRLAPVGNCATVFRMVATAVCIVFAAIFSSSISFADDAVALTQNTPSSFGITVNGHAEFDAKPDVCYASLGVVTQALKQSDAASQNAVKSDAVRKALTDVGVADSDIQTDYYQISPQYDNRSSPPVLTGYQVSNFFKVSIRTLAKAGVVVDRATDAGANQVSSVTYDLADRGQVEGQALAAAVTNARSKADLVAGVAGVTVGRLLNITETGDDTPPPVPVMPMYRMAMAEAPQHPPTEIKPQDIVVTADVTALYAIGYGDK